MHKKNKFLKTCPICGKKFFTEIERKKYIKNKWKHPNICKDCKESIIKQKLTNRIINHPENYTFNQIDIGTINATDNKTLFIIGNGFDIVHGVNSRYTDFKKFLYPKSKLKYILNNYIAKFDIWGNLEDSLAFLDRNLLNNLDNFMEICGNLDEDDEDFSYGQNLYAPIDLTLEPAYMITVEMPKLFRKWVTTFQTPAPHSTFVNLFDPNSYYINFNYTEFLETVYGINRSQITYIHGNRLNKKEPLAFGHGYDTEELFENWAREQNRASIDKKSPLYLAYFNDDDENLENYRSAIQYYAIDIITQRLETYFDKAQKNVKEIIKKYEAIFTSLNDIEQIIILGHSLSTTDYLYFKKLIEVNKNSQGLKWKICWYNIDDLVRQEKFLEAMNISLQQVEIFRI